MKKLLNLVCTFGLVVFALFFGLSCNKQGENLISPEGKDAARPSPHLGVPCIQIVNQPVYGQKFSTNVIVIRFNLIIPGAAPTGWVNPSTDMNYHMGFENPCSVSPIKLFRLSHIGPDAYQLSVPEFTGTSTNPDYLYVANVLHNKGFLPDPNTTPINSQTPIRCGLNFGTFWSISGQVNTSIPPLYPSNCSVFNQGGDYLGTSCCQEEQYTNVFTPIKACWFEGEDFEGLYQEAIVEVSATVYAQYPGMVGSTANDILYLSFRDNGGPYMGGIAPHATAALVNGNYEYRYRLTSAVPSTFYVNSTCFDIVLATSTTVNQNLIASFGLTPLLMCYCR